MLLAKKLLNNFAFMSNLKGHNAETVCKCRADLEKDENSKI
jgi:hypothetical protein